MIIHDIFNDNNEKGLSDLGILRDSNISGDGEIVKQYESKLSHFFKSDHCIAVSSGTAAILVSIKALGLKKGDIIITTPVSPLCTVYPLIASELDIKFADTNKNSFDLNIDQLKRLASKYDVKAIIDIPMWGYPNHANDLFAFTRDNGIPLIFDLAHCFGTTFNDEHLNHYCDIACYSTHNNKVFSTGEGGFILTKDSNLANRCISYSRFGKLDGINLGLNYKLSGIQAALGLKRLNNISIQLNNRISLANELKANLKNKNIQSFYIIELGNPNYYRFLLKSNNLRKQLSAHLIKHLIPSDTHKYDYKPLYEYPILSSHEKNCLNANALIENTNTITIHPNFSPEQIQYLIDVLNKFNA